MIVNRIHIQNRGKYTIFTASTRRSCFRQLEEMFPDFRKLPAAKEKWNERGYELWLKL